MRSVTFKSVLHGAAALAGMRPADLTTDRAATLTEYINNRVAEGWRRDFWPEWTVVSQRQYHPSYDATKNVTAGDVRYDEASDAYYTALQNQTPAAEGPTNAAYWAAVDETFEPVVPYEEAGLEAIDEVKRVLRRNPRTHPTQPGELDWEPVESGILVHQRPGQPKVPRPWVNYRRRPPVFDSKVWTAGEVVAAGAVRYYAATGECYLALAGSEGVIPPSDATKWELVKFPAALGGWVKRAVFSDTLRDQKQTDRAMVELGQAQDELQDAVDRALGQQGMWDRARVEVGY
jgi:hypothetical protein